MGTVLTYRVVARRRFYGIVRKRRFNRCETGLNPFDVMFQSVKADSAEKILKGFRAYYDYVRPHMALDGHTPTQEAAIPIQLGTNRWLDLIRQAARDKR